MMLLTVLVVGDSIQISLMKFFVVVHDLLRLVFYHPFRSALAPLFASRTIPAAKRIMLLLESREYIANARRFQLSSGDGAGWDFFLPNSKRRPMIILRIR